MSVVTIIATEIIWMIVLAYEKW